MAKLNFFVSLTTNDNDYQQEQAAAAEETAARLGAGVRIVYADNDSVKQGGQILSAIHAPEASRPNAIIFEPVGSTALPQAARAAVAAMIGWVVINQGADYIRELRRTARSAIFAVSSDHLEIGRMQGQQFAALLPNGGAVLYIQGPSDNSAARQRTVGMQETKPANISVITLRAQWTEESAQRAVASWMKLSTSQKQRVDLVSAQDDSMALGARKAMQEETDERVRAKWLRLPFTGCDGLPKTGQEYVRKGLLAATVFCPPNTTLAMEMLVTAIQSGKQPPELALTPPSSIPPLDDLGKR